MRTAEFVMLLGPEDRGRGVARESILLTLAKVFTSRFARNLAQGLGHNTDGIAAYEHAGFKQAGR